LIWILISKEKSGGKGIVCGIVFYGNYIHIQSVIQPIYTHGAGEIQIYFQHNFLIEFVPGFNYVYFIDPGG